MSFELVDRFLNPWLEAKHLHVFTQYKDAPVRSLQIVNSAGARVQIWIDQPSADGQVGVHAWDYGRQRHDLSGRVEELPTLLDLAYDAATQWLGLKWHR